MDGITRLPGFTKRPNRKPIEALVDGYLRLVTSGNRLRQERKFIEKAIVIINTIFGHPCCDNPSSEIDLITPYDNQLTTSLKNILTNNAIIRRSFRLALMRILDRLNDYLYGCCTETLTFNFPAGILGTLLQVQVIDSVSGKLIYTTTVQNNTVQTVVLSQKYFGPGGSVKICLNILTPAGGITNYYVNNNLSQTLVIGKTVGVVCGTIVQPLAISYTVTQA